MRRSSRLALVTLLLIALLALSLVVDCDAAKKKKSKKAKVKAEGSKIGEGEGGEGKDGEEKPKKKKWKDMTKADWDKLEREADADEEEPFKMPEAPNVQFDPKNPAAYLKASKKGKPAMMFSSLDKIKDEKTGKMRERTKEETEVIAFRHKNLMQSNHLDTTPYVIEDNKILWTVHDGSRGYDVKSFLMRQPEVVEFEWDQQKTTKDNWKPKDDPEDEL